MLFSILYFLSCFSQSETVYTLIYYSFVQSYNRKEIFLELLHYRNQKQSYWLKCKISLHILIFPLRIYPAKNIVLKCYVRKLFNFLNCFFKHCGYVKILHKIILIFFNMSIVDIQCYIVSGVKHFCFCNQYEVFPFFSIPADYFI